MTTIAARPLTIRPIEPEDADALVRFHHGLSPETTRRRFLVFHPELSAREVAWFTTVDHDRREAVVALHGGEIVGVARYDRLGARDAEVAIVVADAWQRRGVGTALLTALAARATDAGITDLLADTLPENAAIVRLLERVGVVYDRTVDDGVATVRLRLVPGTSGRSPESRGPSALQSRDPAGLHCVTGGVP